MSRPHDTTWIDFRGESEVEVSYIDRGPDPSVNVHEIEFWISDERFKDYEPTEEENDAIYRRLAEMSWDRAMHEHFPDDVI